MTGIKSSGINAINTRQNTSNCGHWIRSRRHRTAQKAGGLLCDDHLRAAWPGRARKKAAGCRTGFKKRVGSGLSNGGLRRSSPRSGWLETLAQTAEGAGGISAARTRLAAR